MLKNSFFRGNNSSSSEESSNDEQQIHSLTSLEMTDSLLCYQSSLRISCYKARRLIEKEQSKNETPLFAALPSSMETSYSQSTFEILPDEILLEVCKYLLCTDILYSFTGLNYRLTRMIAQYRHHLSFHKTSISKFDYLCINVLPQIGSQIRSLVLDCCYSVLQDQLFIKHFGEKMAMIFPNLERITLVSYEYDPLLKFLNTLHDLHHFVEIRLYSLFPIQRLQQPTLVRLLMQGNNHRFTTIFLDQLSTSLSFDGADCYLNILQLHIKLKTIADLPSLFTAVPNVQYLDVIIEEGDQTYQHLDEMKLSPLLHLTDFRLKSTVRLWDFGELTTLLIQLPTVRSLSLFLSTYDQRLIKGDIILPSLPSTVQQFNYAIYFISATHDGDETIISSWPSSHPIVSFFDNRSMLIHTIPWSFARLELSSLVGKMTSYPTNNINGYDQHVEQLYLRLDKNLTFGKSLTILSQCRRVRDIIISMTNDGSVVKEEKLPVFNIPQLSRLIQIWFYGSIPSDLNYFSFILNAAPNLFRLDLSFAHLLRFIENPQICQILSQRITSLCIVGNEANPTLVTINEEHLPIIASIFPRISDMSVDMTHLPSSSIKISKEDIAEDSLPQKDIVIGPLSSESMLLCLLTTFKEHHLIGLCVDGHFLEQIKRDPEQWLQDNTILCEQPFQAAFNSELNRLLIWM